MPRRTFFQSSTAPLWLAIPLIAWATVVRGDEHRGESERAAGNPLVRNESDELASRIAGLIEQLGNDDYFVRERAQQELSKIGFEAFDALEAATDHEDIEIAARVKHLVGQLQIEWTVAGDPPEVKRLVQNYGTKDEAARLAVVSQLIDLPADKGLPVLCRLVRFDKSLVLSKLVALAIIEQKKITDDRWPTRERTIRETLGHSPRVAAEWLRTYVGAHKDPASSVATWGKLAEAEQRTLLGQPHLTQLQLVCALWRQQVATLRKLDRRDEAVAAMLRIVDLEEGQSETLTELVNWLVEQEAWTVVDTVAKRFADRIERDPILLYILAQASLARGDEPAAQDYVDKALALNGGNSYDSLAAHCRAAKELQHRGMIQWCQNEYRHVIRQGTAGDIPTLYAQRGLSELLHDQGEDEEAYKVFAVAVKARELKEKNKDGEAQRLSSEFGAIETVRARLQFFAACGREAAGDRAGQLAALKAGLEEDPTEVDVLIALYRFPDLDMETKDKVRRHIRETADGFRTQIQEAADDPTAYNQLAWLIANTEGDPHEAQRHSEKSLELLRAQLEDKDIRLAEAGFLDTLARCHYAAGDLAGAVEIQSRAVEQDAHSGQMKKQLAFFQDAQAQAEKKTP